jgi:hypothetical protein
MAKEKKTGLPASRGELEKLIRDAEAELLSIRFAFGPGKDRASKKLTSKTLIAKAKQKLRELGTTQ